MYSNPWIELDSFYDINSLFKTEKCNPLETRFQNYPLSYGQILFYINNLNLDFVSKDCIEALEDIKILIQKRHRKSNTEIGFQKGHDSMFLQSKDQRYYFNDNFYFSHSNAHSKLAYKIKISKDLDKDKYFFDESYISYRLKNNVISIGRKSRWWSPSERTSLILSNAARPTYGLDFQNYIPIKPNSKYMKFLGNLDYEFFVNKLEKNREVSNALLFGNRITIRPSSKLDISLIRLAQFGGKGRPKNIDTIINMLIGRDNASSNLSFEDQPGNQIAGMDFTYYLKNNKKTKIYSQFLGEDEAGFFPSRKFYLFGLSSNLSDSSRPSRFHLDFVDTYSGIPNYSYNHGLYKSGLRHYGIPIGASIDADSSESSVTYYKTLSNNKELKFTYYDAKINKNDGEKNFWSNNRYEVNGIDITYKYKFKNTIIKLIYSHKNQSEKLYDDNNIFITVRYMF